MTDCTYPQQIKKENVTIITHDAHQDISWQVTNGGDLCDRCDSESILKIGQCWHSYRQKHVFKRPAASADANHLHLFFPDSVKTITTAIILQDNLHYQHPQL